MRAAFDCNFRRDRAFATLNWLFPKELGLSWFIKVDTTGCYWTSIETLFYQAQVVVNSSSVSRRFLYSALRFPFSSKYASRSKGSHGKLQQNAAAETLSVNQHPDDRTACARVRLVVLSSDYRCPLWFDFILQTWQARLCNHKLF